VCLKNDLMSQGVHKNIQKIREKQARDQRVMGLNLHPPGNL